MRLYSRRNDCVQLTVEQRFGIDYLIYFALTGIENLIQGLEWSGLVLSD